MANQRQLDILKQGVGVWNQWRNENPSILPDLSDTNLSHAVLMEANFSGANLCKAVLKRVNFRYVSLLEADLSNAIIAEAELSDANLLGANLRGAKLDRAILNRAVLSHANLNQADLRDAVLKMASAFDADLSDANLLNADLSASKLSGAKLSGAYLSGAKLINADLRGAKLSEADLINTCLYDANLIEADLSKALLSNADLRGADLSKAHLNDAKLINADLSYAMCEKANFSGTDFERACLFNANLDGAILTGALLWQTQRANWSIKGVICDSAYLDEEDILTTFAPGEFERLYSDKTKIVLLYKDGISPFEITTLPTLIKHLEESYPGYSLRLESISDGAGGAAVTLVVEDVGEANAEDLKQLKAAIETKAKEVIEYQRIALAEREIKLRLEGEVTQLNAVVDKLIMRPSHFYYHQGDITIGDTYNTNQAGAVGPNAYAHDITFNQNNKPD
jgi:uncharacterized protein YjbI with pentapeptide repeats